MKLLYPFVFIAILSIPTLSWGQTNRSRHWEFTTQTGPFLPNEVPGVQEIVPLTVFRLNFPLLSFRPEFSYYTGRSDGIDYQMYSMALVNYLSYDPELSVFWTFGLTQVEYIGLTVNLEPADTPEHNSGFMISGGLELPDSGRVKFRGEVGLVNGPGRSAWVGLGMTISLGEVTSQNSSR
ncbi:MAG: hypothetical protein CL675_11400 [Bdellovibrionaceae bacterium]|nr:hypothetical protein [Pseudobdellovibrionaceae bacterium]